MKKAHKKVNYIFILNILMCLFLFNTGCGLDVFYIMDAPSKLHEPVYSNIDTKDRYFYFRTAEESVDAGLVFEGTAVYYKIYHDPSKIETGLGSTSSTENVDTSMNVTRLENKHFVMLRSTHQSDYLIIPGTGDNRNIKIRLTNSTLQGETARIVIVNGGNERYLYGSEEKTIPIRDNQDRAFNFGGSGTKDAIPTHGDSDVDTNPASGSESEWYVAMYAVGVAHKADYSTVYSDLVYLGSVKIDASSETN